MTTNKIYRRLLKRLAASTALGLMAASSQAGLFCDWNCDHKRPYVSPACHPTWGYHETCWRQFPPTEPCNDWGAHCPSCQTGGFDAATSYGPSPATMMQQGPTFQQAPMNGIIQQGGIIQPNQALVVPMQAAPQGNWQQYNADPAMAPPISIPPNSAQSNSTQPQMQQPAATPQQDPRVFQAEPQNGGSAPENQNPGGSGVGNGSGNGFEDLQLPNLPPMPDISQRAPYYNLPVTSVHQSPGMPYGNQMPYAGAYAQPVSQAQMAAPNTPQMGMPAYGAQPQMPMPQQQYGQPQQFGAVGIPNGQMQPSPNMAQYPAVQVAPGRRTPVMGISYTQGIKPATSEPKRSILSRINPFSK